MVVYGMSLKDESLNPLLLMPLLGSYHYYFDKSKNKSNTIAFELRENSIL